MSKKTLRRMALITLVGTVFQFGGCFNQALLREVAINAAYDFVFDNDGILDLFGDDAPGLAG